MVDLQWAGQFAFKWKSSGIRENWWRFAIHWRKWTESLELYPVVPNYEVLFRVLESRYVKQHLMLLHQMAFEYFL